MASFRSKIVNALVVNRHLFRGKFRKEVFDMNTSIAGFRQLCEDGTSRYAKIPEGIQIRAEQIEGLNAEWILPEHANPEKLILYVHGGGYVSGSCNDHRGFVSKFAKNCGITCLQFEYRLAPEFPFPYALEDSVKVYQWLLRKGYHAKNILVAGESAGGGLCLATLLALKERLIELPAAAVAISPWTDLTCSGESYLTKNKVSAAPKDSWTVFSKYYAGDKQPEHPLISPLFGDLKGLPPLFINSGVDDELFDDGEQFYLKVRAAGVDATFRAGEGMLHCYPLFAPLFREATEAMDEIVVFVRKHLNQ